MWPAVTLKTANLSSLSSDLIPIRKTDGPPCRIVVNRDPFRDLGFRGKLGLSAFPAPNGPLHEIDLEAHISQAQS